MLRPRPILDKAVISNVRHVLHDGKAMNPRSSDSLVKVGERKNWQGFVRTKGYDVVRLLRTQNKRLS